MFEDIKEESEHEDSDQKLKSKFRDSSEEPKLFSSHRVGYGRTSDSSSSSQKWKMKKHKPSKYNQNVGKIFGEESDTDSYDIEN